MDPTVSVRFRRSDGNVACLRCGRLVDVCNVIVTVEENTPEGAGSSWGVDLCPLCLAAAIEEATGFKMVRQLVSWYRVRETASRVKGLASDDKAS